MNIRAFLFIVVGFITGMFSHTGTCDLSWRQNDTITTSEGTQTVNQTIYIAGDRFAIETTEGLRMVFDLAAGTLITIDMTEKTYSSTSLKELETMRKNLLDQTDSIIEEALKGMPEDQKKQYREELEEQFRRVQNEQGSEPTWQEYKKTGLTETIAGFSATKYEAKTSSGGIYEVWCSREIDTTELRSFLDRAAKSSLMKDIGREFAAITLGFPLKSSVSDRRTKNRSIVTSISFQRLQDEVFAVPKGFKKIEGITGN